MQLDLQIAVASSETIPTSQHFTDWAQLLESELLADRQHEVGCCIRVIDATEMQQYNREYRDKDQPTNVLSFPLPAQVEEDLEWLGDILICAEVVEQEAVDQGKDIQAHWSHITLHGLLHLLGYDHLNDQQAEEMEALEVALLATLGFPNPYETEAPAS